MKKLWWDKNFEPNKPLKYLINFGGFFVLSAMFIYFKNYIYLTLFLSCVLGLIILRDKNVRWIFIPVILLILSFTQVLNTMVAMNTINIPIFKKPGEVLQQLYTSKSGLQVLPTEVKIMLNLAEDNTIENYRFEGRLQSQGEIYQRMVEAGWPRKYSESSEYVFIYEDETPTCKILATEGGIALAKCN